MKKTALDTWDVLPKDMMLYLRHNGWHFNKKACEYAVSLMRDRNGSKSKPFSKEQVDEMMSMFGVKIESTNDYDYVYVANMCKNDYLNSSISDENHLALFVKDTIEDVDSCDGHIFRRWYSDMVGMGEMIFWEDLV